MSNKKLKQKKRILLVWRLLQNTLNISVNHSICDRLLYCSNKKSIHNLMVEFKDNNILSKADYKQYQKLVMDIKNGK